MRGIRNLPVKWGGSVLAALAVLILMEAARGDAKATNQQMAVGSSSVLLGIRVVSAQARSGVCSNPEKALDGNPRTAFSYEWGNGGASLLLDLGKPCVLQSVRVTNGESNQVFWVTEISVGADGEHLRPLQGRNVNLSMERGAVTEIPLNPAAARFVRVAFAGGGDKGEIAEVNLFGRENCPERHLMWWGGNVRKDLLDRLDYLDHDLGVTDLWLDYVETAFPQGNRNTGFQSWIDSGAFSQLRQRGIHYWLSEHEGFTSMVNGADDLRDDLKWETTFRQMRHVYAKAKRLGFRGLVIDAEDYTGVSLEAQERYKEAADFVDAWTFADEFGYSGLYYQRGLQFGKVLKEVWGGPLLQVYEARMYAGKGDCRAGNYWWLKGIHDAGTEVWIATEKTYGAGNGEIAEVEPDHVKRWFVNLPEFIPRVHAAYPFAARVLPGFHPWNCRLRKPNYLPKYLDEQLTLAESCALGYWIYNEGNPHAGDPRDTLDREFCNKYRVTPEDYLRVFTRHPTSRRPRGR